VISGDLPSSVGPDNARPTASEDMTGGWEAQCTAWDTAPELIGGGMILGLARMLVAFLTAGARPEACVSVLPSDDDGPDPLPHRPPAARLHRPTRPDPHLTIQHYDHFTEPDPDRPRLKRRRTRPRELFVC
jgi:hypothetical protein